MPTGLPNEMEMVMHVLEEEGIGAHHLHQQQQNWEPGGKLPDPIAIEDFILNFPFQEFCVVVF